MKGIGIEIKWAIIFNLMMLAWVFIEKLLGFHDKLIEFHPIFTNLIAIPAITIYFFALKERRNSHFENTFTWKNGFTSGMILTVLISVLSPLTQYISHNYISINYFQNVIAYAIQTKHMTQFEAEKYFTLKNYMLQASFGSLIMGAITTIIVSFFIKSKK